MEHSNFSALVWLTEFSPQVQQGKPTGIILLIMDIIKLFLRIFQRPMKAMEDFSESILIFY